MHTSTLSATEHRHRPRPSGDCSGSVGEGGGIVDVRVCGELGVLVRDLVAVAEHLGRKRWWNLGDQGS